MSKFNTCISNICLLYTLTSTLKKKTPKCNLNLVKAWVGGVNLHLFIVAHAAGTTHLGVHGVGDT